MARFPLRDDDRRPIRYRLVSGFFRWSFRLYFFRRLHFEGFEAIPKSGAFILASNHLSNLDPLLLGGFFPRTLHCMAKKELFKGRLLTWILEGCNTFPIDRDAADRRSLSRAVTLLKARGRLLLFIEGTRARVPGMKTAESGVGFIQRRSGAAVLPMAIWGSEQALLRGALLPRRAHIHIRVGKILDLPKGGARADDQATADRIGAAIAALLPPEYRGVYAESP